MTIDATKYYVKESDTHKGLFALYAKPYSILTPDEAQGASPLRDKEWFERFQPLLLKMANTDYGRDLLHIENRPYIVTDFRKDHITYYKGDGKFLWEFRTGCKWANVIRGRWAEFKKFAKEFYEIELEGKKMYRPLLQYKGELVAAGATETFMPEAWEGDDTVSGSLAHMHHSYSHSGGGIGVSYQHVIRADSANETKHSSPTTANYADQRTLFAASREGNGSEAQGAPGWGLVTQYNRPRDNGHATDCRAVIVLDTSAITDAGSIDSATLSWYNAETDSGGGAGSGGNDFTMSNYNNGQGQNRGVVTWSDIDTASDTVLEPDDWFDAAGGYDVGDDAHRYNTSQESIEIVSGNYPGGEWVDHDIAESGTEYDAGGGINLISKTGKTQFCSFDLSYAYPCWSGNTGVDRGRDSSTGNNSDYMMYRTGDHTGTDYDVKLVVEGTFGSAFTPTPRFFSFG